MAGYQTIEALRPILHRGPPPTPVVDIALVRPVGIVRQQPRSKAYRVSFDEICSIISMRLRGESYRAICKALNVSNPTVRRYAGHIVPPGGKLKQGWDTGARQRIKRNVEFATRLRKAGFSYEEIGENIGCCISEVIRIFRPRKKNNTGGPVSRMVVRVARVTGFSCSELRKNDFEQGGRTSSDRAKARAILYWLIRHRLPNMSYPKIGGSLGGFDHTSVINGVRRAEAAAELVGISAQTRPMRAVRLLWEAEWPKASR